MDTLRWNLTVRDKKGGPAGIPELSMVCQELTGLLAALSERIFGVGKADVYITADRICISVEVASLRAVASIGQVIVTATNRHGLLATPVEALVS